MLQVMQKYIFSFSSFKTMQFYCLYKTISIILTTSPWQHCMCIQLCYHHCLPLFLNNISNIKRSCGQKPCVELHGSSPYWQKTFNVIPKSYVVLLGCIDIHMLHKNKAWKEKHKQYFLIIKAGYFLLRKCIVYSNT